MTATDRLADFLDSRYETPDDDESRSKFRIDTESAACWALRKLERVREHAAEIRRVAAEQRATIDEWEQQELATLDRDDRFFDGALGDYLRRLLDDQLAELIASGLTHDEAWDKLRSKSKKLPAGTISASKGRDKIVVDDEEAVLAWAKDHCPDAVNPKPVLVKSALDQYNRDNGSFVTPDGEKVPGVHIENPGVTYKASPSGLSAPSASAKASTSADPSNVSDVHQQQ